MKKETILFKDENGEYTATLRYELGLLIVKKNREAGSSLYSDEIILEWHGLTLRQMKNIREQIISGGFMMEVNA